jgi:hypothetical protein
MVRVGDGRIKVGSEEELSDLSSPIGMAMTGLGDLSIASVGWEERRRRRTRMRKRPNAE